MSTEIATLRGHFGEYPIVQFGGPFALNDGKPGPETLCVQLGTDYLQLTQRDARELIKILNSWLEEINA